ncbi:MAG: RNA polymerase sporulation sigma factor SigK, partial [Clostridia bacterium]|nr:RNA polymerase sporulation sigma factor SigK [Clostridia bacterium]
MFSAILQFASKIFCFTSYVSNKESYPQPLTPKQEDEYLKKYAQGDGNAREVLIKHNLRLVAHIAKKYSHSMDVDDLISIGSIGLVKGISTYRQGKGTQLATYLARCIENEILMALRSSKKYRNTFSLDEPLGIDGDGNEFALIDVLSVNQDSVFHQVEIKMLSQKLDQVMKSCLTNREYKILQLRYGLGEKPAYTQLKTAEMLGISRSYISRIEKKALQKIREKIKKEDY